MESSAYVIEGIFSVGIIAFVLSLLGLPFLHFLPRRDARFRGPGQVTILDLLCLLALAGPVTGFVWNLFPEGDKLDGVIYVAVFLLLAIFWWWRVTSGLSRNGILGPLRRVTYQLTAVPFGFLGPPVVAMFLLEILHSQDIRPPSPCRREIGVVVLCVLGYLACIPITLWVGRISSNR